MFKATPEICKEYSEAKPQPHIVLDNIWDEDLLKEIISEWPEEKDSRWFQNNTSPKANKRRICALSSMGTTTRKFFEETLHGKGLLKELNILTGIEIFPNPKLTPGGLHESPHGGFLRVHTDPSAAIGFSDRHRVLNFLIYLNPDWKEGDGGELGLWEDPRKECTKKVAPKFNRTLIFDVRDAWHGHPEPYLGSSPRRCICVFYNRKCSDKQISIKWV